MRIVCRLCLHHAKRYSEIWKTAQGKETLWLLKHRKKCPILYERTNLEYYGLKDGIYSLSQPPLPMST